MFCPDCENKFGSAAGLSCHLTRSDCDGTPTDRQFEIARGMALGDGRIDQDRLRIIMTNKGFLEWLDNELGWLANGVSVFRTPEEVAENCGGVYISEDCNFQTQYELSTLNKFKGLRDEFYGTEKQFPKNKEKLTIDEVRLWYACDGTLGRDRVEIAIHNYMDSREKIESLFDNLGYDIRVYDNNKAIMITEDSAQFFRNTDPVPGFEYKWPEDERV